MVSTYFICVPSSVMLKLQQLNTESIQSWWMLQWTVLLCYALLCAMQCIKKFDFLDLGKLFCFNLNDELCNMHIILVLFFLNKFSTGVSTSVCTTLKWSQCMNLSTPSSTKCYSLMEASLPLPVPASPIINIQPTSLHIHTHTHRHTQKRVIVHVFWIQDVNP